VRRSEGVCDRLIALITLRKTRGKWGYQAGAGTPVDAIPPHMEILP
jgi:hypothetical protein